MKNFFNEFKKFISRGKRKIEIHLLRETNKIHCIKCENLLHTV